MKLNYLEFLLVNNSIRAYVQKKYELPILMNMVASNAFGSVLEIGCGNGNGTKLIRKYFNPRHITAIDLDEKMIQIAQETVPDGSTIFQVMDASKLDFPDESFDAIFDFSSIHHIPNWKNCIEELKRVLKVGGKLILEEFSIDTFSGFPGRLYRSLLSHPYEHMFSTDEIVRYIEDVGFQIDDIKKVNPLKMMPHFFLLASVPWVKQYLPDNESDYENWTYCNLGKRYWTTETILGIMGTPLEQKSSLEEIRKRFDLDLLRKVGFRHIDLLHKNSCFAAFGAVKTG